MGFDSKQGKRLFSFLTASRPSLEPKHPHIGWLWRDVSYGVKIHIELVPRLRMVELDLHSPPTVFTAESLIN
jgi:hypothetical protein